MPNNLESKKIGVTVSICLFCYNNDEKKVLTVKNRKAPYEGALILGTNKLLKWEISKNMMRPKSDYNKVKMNFEEEISELIIDPIDK